MDVQSAEFAEWAGLAVCLAAPFLCVGAFFSMAVEVKWRWILLAIAYVPAALLFVHMAQSGDQSRESLLAFAFNILGTGLLTATALGTLMGLFSRWTAEQWGAN